jgi:hypothetical protein
MASDCERQVSFITGHMVRLQGDLAAVWLGIGNMDKTFDYLNECIDKRMGPVACFIEYPPYKTLKQDPRFQELKHRMGV